MTTARDVKIGADGTISIGSFCTATAQGKAATPCHVAEAKAEVKTESKSAPTTTKKKATTTKKG